MAVEGSEVAVLGIYEVKCDDVCVYGLLNSNIQSIGKDIREKASTFQLRQLLNNYQANLAPAGG